MAEEKRVVILPIQEEFSEAILAGRKRFEFRKTMGDHDPILVLLYIRESGWIVGAFSPGRILRGSPAAVWRLTSGRGTSRERFDSYFEGQDRAVALEVRRFERFSSPITDAEISSSGVVLPPNFNLVYASDRLVTLVRDRGLLLKELERRLPSTGLESFGSLEILDFAPGDREPFVSLVTEEIGKWYDNVGIEFAEGIIASYEGGRDPHGLLSVRKTIHVVSVSGNHVGFSVATEKRGGSVKFGPTVIKKAWQGHGLGGLARRQLEEIYRGRGARKAYSTIPDSHQEALTYLLKTGYRVEAHLRAHYSRDHGEFVVGKRLRRQTAGRLDRHKAERVRDQLRISLEPPPERVLTAFVLSHMSVYYDGLDESFVQELLEARTSVPQEQKPRTTMYAYAGAELVGVCSLSGKRGGAVKLAPLAVVDDPHVFTSLLESSEKHATQRFDARKAYTIIPVDWGDHGETLVGHGYDVEGVLSEPYKPGIDMFVFSKFPK